MGHMGKKTPKHRPPEAPAAPTLGGLMAGLGFEASQSDAEPAAPKQTLAADVVDLATQGRLVLQVQRKGRGGKTVTLLGGISASPAALKQLARTLGRALGTGARIEGSEIVLQGDTRERTYDWLTKQGARTVSH